MALNRCPHCNNPLTGDEWLRGACPGCGKSLASPITASPAPAPREPVWAQPAPEPFRELREGRDQPRSRNISGRQFLGWASVRTSLTLTGAGIILYFGSAVLARLLGEALRGTRGDPGAVFFMLLTLLGLMIIWGAIQALSGMCMVVAVPSESRARGWPIGTIISFALGVLFLVIIAGSRREYAEMIKLLVYLLSGTVFLGRIFFAAFLWGVASHFRQTGLSISCLIYIPLEGVFDIVFFIVRMANIEARGPNPAFLISENWPWTLGNLAFGVWLLVNLFAVRAVITRNLLRREQ